MESEDTLRNRMADHAAEWLIRLAEDRSPQAQREFEAWCAQHPQHVHVFEAAQRMWAQFDGLDRSFPAPPAQVPRASVVDGAAGFKPGPLVRWLAQQGEVDASLARRRHTRWLSIAAGVGILTVGLLLQLWAPWARESYSTAVGSQQVFKLSDGSIVQLNTDSRIEVRFNKDEREIRLPRGEALFTVAHDANRPFYVVTDNARVRALGTKFNVYRQANGQTRVAVLEGIVQLSVDERRVALPHEERFAEHRGQMPGPQPPTAQIARARDEAATDRSRVRLTAGSEATVVGAAISRPAVADVQRAVAWQTRKLVFDAVRLDEIVAEFNRYNQTRIVILDESIGSRRMSGTFEADDPGPLIDYLSRDPAVGIERAGSELRIASK